MSIRYTRSGSLADAFEKYADDRIREAQEALDDLVDEYEPRVRESIPIGPPHSREFMEGDLRRSLTSERSHIGDLSEWTLTVGADRTSSYVRYSDARSGVEFFPDGAALQREGDRRIEQVWHEH